MENQENTQTQNAGQVKLPKSTGAMVLGILSIAFCWCYGIVGLVLGIIALVLANKAYALYNENPGKYITVGMAKAGKITGLIGLILSIVSLVIWIIVIIVSGAAVLSSLYHMN